MTDRRTGLKFMIGKTFPANNTVAKFLTVLAMMSNDLARLITLMIQEAPSDCADSIRPKR